MMFERCVFNIPNIHTDALNFILYYPEGFDGIQKYPLLIYLHGAGSRGNNLGCLNLTGPLGKFRMDESCR